MTIEEVIEALNSWEPDAACRVTGGRHVWVHLTDWEAGPAERGGTRCDECGASPPKEERPI